MLLIFNQVISLMERQLLILVAGLNTTNKKATSLDSNSLFISNHYYQEFTMSYNFSVFVSSWVLTFSYLNYHITPSWGWMVCSITWLYSPPINSLSFYRLYTTTQHRRFIRWLHKQNLFTKKLYFRLAHLCLIKVNVPTEKCLFIADQQIPDRNNLLVEYLDCFCT